MKQRKGTFLSTIILLIAIVALCLPASVSAAGSTTRISGTIPLKIYNPMAANITDQGATITWSTNGNATSQVFYDTKFHNSTDEYAYHSPVDSTPVLQHSLALNGLSPGTTYHCRVKSVYGSGELVAISADFTFTTLPAPIAPTVCTMFAMPVCATQATLWGMLGYPGSAATVQVYFQWGKDKTYGNETSHQTITNSISCFMAQLTSLTPNTTYHFRAVAAGDGTAYGQDQVFRTKPWPIIKVVTPGGGECWAQGSRHTICWTFINACGDVKVELLKGGVLCQVISNGTPVGCNGSGSLSWTVPSKQATGSDYQIRITSLSEPGCTASSNRNFTITRK
jgi:Purple acid Phosphatase, N-terminal domain/Kre9/KNH-like N-terminal Ig-like domain